MRGLTIKQWHREQFYALCEAYRTIDPITHPTDFIRLSVAIHAAKGHVPKSLWRLAKRPGSVTVKGN